MIVVAARVLGAFSGRDEVHDEDGYGERLACAEENAEPALLRDVRGELQVDQGKGLGAGSRVTGVEEEQEPAWSHLDHRVLSTPNTPVPAEQWAQILTYVQQAGPYEGSAETDGEEGTSLSLRAEEQSHDQAVEAALSWEEPGFEELRQTAEDYADRAEQTFEQPTSVEVSLFRLGGRGHPLVECELPSES